MATHAAACIIHVTILFYLLCLSEQHPAKQTVLSAPENKVVGLRYHMKSIESCSDWSLSAWPFGDWCDP